MVKTLTLNRRVVGPLPARRRDELESSRRRRWVCWRIAVSCQHQATVALGLSMRLHRRWVCWRIAVSCQHQATVALGLSMRLHRRCCLLHHMSHSLSEDSESGRRSGSSEHAGAMWWRLGPTRAVPISRRPLPPHLFTPSAQLRALSPPPSLPLPPSLSLSNPFFCAVQSRHLILWWMHLTVRTSTGQTAASRR